MAATAEVIALTTEHLAHEAGPRPGGGAERLRWCAQTERREAQRLWALADRLEG
jgi:hypothetical protein